MAGVGGAGAADGRWGIVDDMVRVGGSVWGRG